MSAVMILLTKIFWVIMVKLGVYKTIVRRLQNNDIRVKIVSANDTRVQDFKLSIGELPLLFVDIGNPNIINITASFKTVIGILFDPAQMTATLFHEYIHCKQLRAGKYIKRPRFIELEELRKIKEIAEGEKIERNILMEFWAYRAQMRILYRTVKKLPKFLRKTVIKAIKAETDRLEWSKTFTFSTYGRAYLETIIVAYKSIFRL